MDKMEKTSEKKKGFVKEFVDFLQTFGVIGLGDFISQIIYFIIIALVVFIMYKQLKRFGLAKL